MRMARSMTKKGGCILGMEHPTLRWHLRLPIRDLYIYVTSNCTGLSMAILQISPFTPSAWWSMIRLSTSANNMLFVIIDSNARFVKSPIKTQDSRNSSKEWTLFLSWLEGWEYSKVSVFPPFISTRYCEEKTSKVTTNISQSSNREFGPEFMIKDFWLLFFCWSLDKWKFEAHSTDCPVKSTCPTPSTVRPDTNLLTHSLGKGNRKIYTNTCQYDLEQDISGWIVIEHLILGEQKQRGITFNPSNPFSISMSHPFQPIIRPYIIKMCRPE